MINSKSPLVSIIIPTFNRAHLIGETLLSIQNQTYRHWECIIVDDGSTDNTATVINEYLKQDSRITYYKRPRTRVKGANTCRNYGFELSKGQYVNWFDDDDLMHPEKIEIQINAIKDKPYNFSVCQTQIFKDQPNNIIGLRHKKIDSEQPLYDFISLRMAFLTQAPFFKKSFLIAHNLSFNEDLQAAQEWEFLSKVLYYSPSYHVTEKPLVLFRKHAKSISHGMEFNKRKWHYFLARRNVLEFLNEKSKYKSKTKIEGYLKNYLKTYFREFLFSKKYRQIIHVYFRTIAPMYGLLKSLHVFVFICFVFLTGKGYAYRKKIMS